MLRTLIAFLATVAVGAMAILIFPYNMVTPGVLIGGHSNLKNNCFACHSAFAGSAPEKCMVCHKPESIGKKVKAEKTATSVNLFHMSLLRNDCFACHTEHNGLSREFATNRFTHELLAADLSKKCSYCHSADEPDNDMHRTVDVNCSECHNISDWKKAEFNHSRFAEKTACIKCHSSDKPKDGIHNFSSADVNCKTCHSTEAWKPASYDHNNYFVFDGNHPSKCDNCHTRMNNFKVYTCYNCHEHSRDRIASKHLEEGIRNFDNCVKCHRSGNEHDGNEGGEGRGGEGGHGEED